MPERHLPVRPNLEQLRHQAKDLLVGVRERDASAVAELQQFRTEKIEPGDGTRKGEVQLASADELRGQFRPR